MKVSSMPKRCLYGHEAEGARFWRQKPAPEKVPVSGGGAEAKVGKDKKS